MRCVQSRCIPLVPTEPKVPSLLPTSHPLANSHSACRIQVGVPPLTPVVCLHRGQSCPQEGQAVVLCAGTGRWGWEASLWEA